MPSSHRTNVRVTEKNLRSIVARILTEARNAPENFLLSASAEFLSADGNRQEVMKILNLIYFNEPNNPRLKTEPSSKKFGGLDYNYLVSSLNSGKLEGEILSSVIEMSITMIVGATISKYDETTGKQFSVPTQDVFSNLDGLIFDETGLQPSLASLNSYLVSLLSGRDYAYEPKPPSNATTSYYVIPPTATRGTDFKMKYEGGEQSYVPTRELNDILMKGVNIRSELISNFDAIVSNSVTPILASAKRIAGEMTGNPAAVPDYLDSDNLEVIAKELTKTYLSPAFVSSTGMSSAAAGCFALVRSANAFYEDEGAKALKSFGVAAAGTIVTLLTQSALKGKTNIADLEVFATGLDDQIQKAKTEIKKAEAAYETYKDDALFQRIQDLKKQLADAEEKILSLATQMGVSVGEMRAATGLGPEETEAAVAGTMQAKISSGRRNIASSKKYESAVQTIKDIRKQYASEIAAKKVAYENALAQWDALPQRVVAGPGGTSRIEKIRTIDKKVYDVPRPTPPADVSDSDFDAEVMRRLGRVDPDLATAYSDGSIDLPHDLEAEIKDAEEMLKKYKGLEREKISASSARDVARSSLYPEPPPGTPGGISGSTDDFAEMRDKIAVIDERVRLAKQHAQRVEASISFLRRNGYFDDPFLTRILNDFWQRSGFRQRAGQLVNGIAVSLLVELLVVGYEVINYKIATLGEDQQVVLGFLREAFAAEASSQPFSSTASAAGFANHLEDLADDWSYQGFEIGIAKLGLQKRDVAAYIDLALSIASFASAAVNGKGVTQTQYGDLNSKLLKAQAK